MIDHQKIGHMSSNCHVNQENKRSDPTPTTTFKKSLPEIDFDHYLAAKSVNCME